LLDRSYWSGIEHLAAIPSAIAYKFFTHVTLSDRILTASGEQQRALSLSFDFSKLPGVTFGCRAFDEITGLHCSSRLDFLNPVASSSE
jgi:hypothetical protein